MSQLAANFLEALLGAASEGVVVHEASGRIAYCNPAAERILGIGAAGIVGHSSSDLGHGAVHQDGSPFPAAGHPVMVTLRTGTPCRNVVMGLASGIARERRWISINAALMPGRAWQDRMAFAVFTDITEHVEAKHRLAEAALRQQKLNEKLTQAEARLRAVLHTIPDAIWVKDPHGAYLLCNPGLERMLGVPEASIVGKFDSDFVDSQRAASFRRSDREAMASNAPVMLEERAAYRDNRHAIIETIKAPMHGADGTIVGVVGIARDITERKVAEDQLRRVSAYQRAILSSTPVGVSVFDAGWRCTEANPAFERIFGFAAGDLVGQSARLLYRDEETFHEIGRAAWSVARQGGTFSSDAPMQHQGGANIWVRQVACMIDPQAPELGIVLTMEDITRQRRMEAQLMQNNAELRALSRDLERLARTDALTGLANRRVFVDGIAREFQRFKRSGQVASALVLDVDHFKAINDTHGHEAGDQALILLASVLASLTRDIDLPARLGGEEFVVLLPATMLPGAVDLAERIRLAAARITARPAGGASFGLTVSIGVACFEDADESWSQLVSRADRAMYRAKALGRNQVAV